MGANLHVSLETQPAKEQLITTHLVIAQFLAILLVLLALVWEMMMYIGVIIPFAYCDGPLPCFGHGRCINTTNPYCICNSDGFDFPSSCEKCRPNYYGSNCTLCPDCGHGQCVAGLSGSGLCSCPILWSGSHCNVFWFNYLGPILFVMILILTVVWFIKIFIPLVQIQSKPMKKPNIPQDTSLVESHEPANGNNRVIPSYPSNDRLREELDRNPLPDYEEDVDPLSQSYSFPQSLPSNFLKPQPSTSTPTKEPKKKKNKRSKKDRREREKTNTQETITF
eukprot:TRINITY_DN9980_c0_g2_i1.p1 TRINITY_DN9980_c0_g2~~TRINITY_DN9980_c0_g2_i1.p1  ORF type:complete len:279 (-),score=48.43 TRINITY_DN9980_c0_g2_i1:147-983(-)